MKIILAPDSFKGSGNAFQMAKAMEKGIRSVHPNAETVRLPMADGGEGTMEILVRASGGFFVAIAAHDPLKRMIEARYGVMGDGITAVIELAEASGLSLLRGDERNPLYTSTFGTGEMILHALQAGYRKFIVCLGGSATNDGGAGMLQALGMKLLDISGAELLPGGIHLSKLHSIDAANFDERVRASQFVIACDVRNPLCGEQGASAIYGPQKGASPESVRQLEGALKQFADVIEGHTGLEVVNLAGSGAAGGTAAALFAFFDAAMESGARLVMNQLRFDEFIRDADWIVTGEGRLDGQTGSGKVIEAVCASAAEQGIPVIAVCGSIGDDRAAAARLGLRACFPIVPGPCTLEDAMSHAEEWMEERISNIFSLL
ncbi:glycerate kinase [Candidatus Pristimantibacillus sp. PTI5]|uniref:glycerate kinase n=1 Tax=Candidatus Pristimantibacillus sp. PTI5 TaxID=3400422 RepID=UPI003B017BC9